MVYKNPVIRGYYADPSVCKANGKYFLVASSSQYFPGVPLFESGDLVNWQQIGFCLTRSSQLPLEGVHSSGGIYAPTIRYDKGRFYMVTTNTGHPKGGNFYVYTDDIYGEWSEPLFVEQGGIDPSLYFENGKTFFTSNGTDENGKNAIIQCEIDIATGKKLSESKVIWHGTGGRYLESPHLYKIKNFYYLMVAEGGTEYGHTVTYSRSENPWGPFVSYNKNPVLTNRNLGPYTLQGIGHGDLLEDFSGNWWIYTLGFRQIHPWQAYHHLGREVCLTPVAFDDEGWFTCANGTTQIEVETSRIESSVKQNIKKEYTFENTSWDKEWVFLRKFEKENYVLEDKKLSMKSSNDTLDMPGSPSFLGLRQKEFDMELSFNVTLLDGEAGITVYMDENHHYDLALVKSSDACNAILRFKIGDIIHLQNSVPVTDNKAAFKIRSTPLSYEFFCNDGKNEISLGKAQSRYLSTEVAGGFTGVMLGLYSQNASKELFNEFTGFSCVYTV